MLEKYPANYIDATEYVRKAEVDEDTKEIRLQGLKDRLAASDEDDEDVEQLQKEIVELEERIEELHRSSLGRPSTLGRWASEATRFSPQHSLRPSAGYGPPPTLRIPIPSRVSDCPGVACPCDHAGALPPFHGSPPTLDDTFLLGVPSPNADEATGDHTRVSKPGPAERSRIASLSGGPDGDGETIQPGSS